MTLLTETRDFKNYSHACALPFKLDIRYNVMCLGCIEELLAV